MLQMVGLMEQMHLVLLFTFCSSQMLVQVDAGLDSELVLGDPKAPRFVLWNNELLPTPSGPDVATFKLLSIWGKIRAGLGAAGFKQPLPGKASLATCESCHFALACRCIVTASCSAHCQQWWWRQGRQGKVSANGTSRQRNGSNVSQSDDSLSAYTTEHEESVEAYVRRNLGAEVFERLIEPFCSGVYAGNPANLSMKAAFGKVSTRLSVSTERSHIVCQACQTVRVGKVVGERHLYDC